MPRPPRLRRRLAAGAVVAVAACLTLPGAASARGLTTGFADGLFMSPDASVRTKWLGRAERAHSQIVRLNVTWGGLAPHRPSNPADPNDPAYAFGPLDAAVQSARSRGLTVLITVYSAPGWAEGGNRPASADPGTWRPKSGPFGDLGRALATRYSGHFGGLPRVRYFEAWNEPNLSAYLTPQYKGRKQTSSAVYRKLLNAFYAGVHAAAPGDSVVSGGLAPYGEDPGGDRTRPLIFLRKLLCLRGKTSVLRATNCPAKAHLDVAGDHPIDTSGGPHRSALNPDDVATPDFKDFRTTVRAAERHHTIKPGGGRPLWATEIWWETKPPDPTGVSPAKQARYLGTALRILKRQGASVAINLQIRDSETPSNGDGTTATGLYFKSGKPKPSLGVWRAHGP